MSQMLFVRLREPGDESPIFAAPTGAAPVFSGAAAASPPPTYTPSLDYSDPRNSQYIALILADD